MIFSSLFCISSLTINLFVITSAYGRTYLTSKEPRNDVSISVRVRLFCLIYFNCDLLHNKIKGKNNGKKIKRSINWIFRD
jgi:hypothetical protein